VHIPYHLTWAHEHVETLPAAEGRFFEVKSIREIPRIIAAL